MHEEFENDLLADVLDLMEAYEHTKALEALRKLDVAALSSEDQGRAAAIEVVCLEWEGNSRKASGLLRKTVKRFSNDESFMLGLGVQLSELDAFDDAEKILRQLCDTAPTSAAARYHLACTLVDADKTDEGLRWFDATIQCDPTFAAGFCGRAWCLRESGKLADAANAYRDYLALEPDQALEWVSLGVVESELGKYEAAAFAYERAYKLEPDSATLHYNWLVTACRQGDAEKAEECAQRLEDIAPDDWRAQMARAQIAEMEGHVWQGWEACQEALETVQQDSSDFDDVHDAALAVLQFATRNEFSEEATELVDGIFDAGIFSEHIFRAVRRLHGRHSLNAYEFLVLISGMIQEDPHHHEHCNDPTHNHAPPSPSHESEARSYAYGRSYVIYAENAEEASREALQFESRYVGGKDLNIDGIEQRSGPTEADLGIAATITGRTIFEPEEDQ